MELWLRTSIILCTFGFFIYLKPSEPFLTAYLEGPVHNLTETQVVNQIYPVWIYSYLALLVPVFLLTDYLKYKPVIIVQSLGHVSCWLLLVFARGVPLMQLMEFCYAVASAGEVAFDSYIYSVVDERHYQRVTSWIRGTTLVGYFIGSLLSQLLVSLANLDYFYLNVISLVDVTIAFFISWLLPMPSSTLFFFSKEEKGTSFRAKPKVTWKTTVARLWSDLKSSYGNATLFRWSAWWALSTCGWLLVVNYVQNLWETIRPSSENDIYNGAVSAAATAFGAVGAFLVGFVKLNWDKWSELALGGFALVMCGVLMAMCWTTSIWVCYVAYVMFIFLHYVVITITQFQIAIGLSTKRFALVFGANTFAALALNTILTIVLIDQAGLALSVEVQFIVYSGYFGVIAVIFLVHAIYSLFVTHNDETSRNIVKTSL